jgi:hypothetical protein
MGEGILFGGPGKCNQELDCGREFACIGKTYRAISKTFEH